MKAKATRKRQYLTHQGLTLVEVMVSMSIFTILAAGTISVTLQTRTQAEYLVYQNAAYTAAQGYLEQIKSMEYNRLEQSVASNTIPLPTKALSYIGSADEGTLEIDDPIYIGSEAKKEVLIDIANIDSYTPREISMPYYVTVFANDLSSTNLEAMEVVISFRYVSPHLAGTKEMSGSVRTVVTGIR